MAKGKYGDTYGFVYNNTRWERARRQSMVEHNYLCVDCRSRGIIKAAECVHHEISVEQDLSLAYEQSNLVPLCNHHHNIRHKRGTGGLKAFLEEWNT